MSEHSDPSSEHIVLDGHCPARVLPFGTYPLTNVQKQIRRAFFNTPLGYSRLRRPFMERFKRDCASGSVDATLFGLKMRFYPQDNQTDAKSAVCGACYNHRELKWLRRHLPKGGTFVDVGANMGFFSLYAAQREARVIAVEPNPVLFERLATNMRLNGMRADLLRVAVGDQEGSGQLVQVNRDFGGGRFYRFFARRRPRCGPIISSWKTPSMAGGPRTSFRCCGAVGMSAVVVAGGISCSQGSE